jgi:nitronate monooxygenase
MENWNIPLLEIGGRKMKLIQGGMGVGISGWRLASAVANEGGMGVIASVGLNEAKSYLKGEYEVAGSMALKDEIKLARSKMNNKGFLGVNIMHALSNYPQLVKTALEENIDFIISGAGIPRDLQVYSKEIGNTHTGLIPIVYSGKLAHIMCRAWVRYEHLPDAIVVEGPMAGGHLGYSNEQLANSEFVAHGLEKIVKEVVESVRPYEKEFGRKIPVIAAGGIFYGGDIRKYLNIGAAGVQMATRFVPTHECDADVRFKQAYLDCKKDDLVIIKSPVGMPGRAIKNEFLEKVEAGKRVPITCPYHCIKTCIPKESPYCIAKALVEAKAGRFEEGYVFAGSNAWRCKEIISVHQVFEDINREYAEGRVSD